MSQLTTEGIEIVARPSFWPERSNPASGRWAFAYDVAITNRGSTPAQLVSRHWIITDGNGESEEVVGEGVVGHKPRLRPGERFEYRSWVLLRTPFGSMRGTYSLLRPDGASFEATIGEFALVLPHALN